MKHRSCFLTLAFLMALVFSTPGIFHAAELPGLRPGMKIEDALNVARNCVREAAAFRERVDANGVPIDHRTMRPDDKLSYLGITDDVRLDTLRRYILRNEELGVQSIWEDVSVRHPDEVDQRYIISKNDLNDISTDWTLTKLAVLISQKAGIPRIPLETAQQIVADCLKNAGDPPKPKTADPVADHVTDLDAFGKCIGDPAAGKTSGIQHVSIISPTGDKVYYELSTVAYDVMKFLLKRPGWKLFNLVNFIHNYAFISFSSRSKAAKIVMGAVINLTLNNICEQQRLKAEEEKKKANEQGLKPPPDIVCDREYEYRQWQTFRVYKERVLRDLITDADLGPLIFHLRDGFASQTVKAPSAYQGETQEKGTVRAKGTKEKFFSSGFKALPLGAFGPGDAKEVTMDTSIGKIIEFVTTYLEVPNEKK